MPKTLLVKQKTKSGTKPGRVIKRKLDFTTCKLYTFMKNRRLTELKEDGVPFPGGGSRVKKYLIAYYKKADGKKPVEIYIKSRRAEEQGRIKRKLDRLEAEGPFLGMPHARKFAGTKIYELRPEGMRLFYYFEERLAVFVHAVDKKDFKQRDIAFADKRRKELER